MKNPYEVLGVAKEATPEKIKAAYRALAKTMHPDQGGNPAKFRELTEAYDLLRDPERRAKFDATGETGRPENMEEAIKAKVLEVASTILQQIIVSLDQDITIMSVRKSAIEFITSQLDEHIEKRGNLKLMLKRAEQMEKRFKKKNGGDSPVHSMLTRHKKGIEDDIEAVTVNITLTEALIEFFEEYDYLTDPAPRAQPTGPVFIHMKGGHPPFQSF